MKKLPTIALLLAVILFAFAVPVAAQERNVDVCHFAENGESRIISVSENALENHLAHGDVECEFEIEVNPENICINVNGVAFRQEGEATCDSVSPTGSEFIKASVDNTETSAGRNGKNMAIAIGYGAQASVGNGSNNTAIANGHGAKASAGNGSNNTARADGIGATACAGLLGYSNTTATASADGATAVAGAVADYAGCVLYGVPHKLSATNAATSSTGSLSNTVECTNISASAGGEGATAVAAGINVRASTVGNITNIVEVGESGSCTVTATANVDYATAVAAGINLQNSNVSGDIFNHVVADAITASATELRSTAAAGGVSIRDSIVGEDIANDVVGDTLSATTIEGEEGHDSKVATGSVLVEITPYAANLSVVIGPGVARMVNNNNDTISVTITPNTGYYIVDVVVDGVSQGAIGSYTFDEVTVDHTINTTIDIDTSPPVIALNGNATVVLEVGVDSYTELGATVTDNDPAYSGSVTIGGDTVNTSTIGTYMVTYDAPADAAGNTPIQVSRTVQVVDTTAPVITLIGEATLTLIEGEMYVEAGATVTDNSGEALSVSIAGSVDSSTAGTYIVTYDASDSSGNAAAQVIRTVIVGTAQAATADLVGTVQGLVDGGALGRGNGNALISKLENAIAKLDQGKPGPAINKIEAFINQVNSLIDEGKLAPGQGQAMVDAAQRIVDALVG